MDFPEIPMPGPYPPDSYFNILSGTQALAFYKLPRKCQCEATAKKDCQISSSEMEETDKVLGEGLMQQFFLKNIYTTVMLSPTRNRAKALQSSSPLILYEKGSRAIIPRVLIRKWLREWSASQPTQLASGSTESRLHSVSPWTQHTLTPASKL